MRKSNWLDYLLLLITAAAFVVALVGLYRFVVQPARYVLTWSTENEIDILGFNVYRADSRDGDYVQVNSELIPAASDPLQSNAYEYVDDTAERGQRYFYRLETLYRDGRAELGDTVIVLPSE